jgi:anti-sigma regulatory factor (Ser/Thr protein kinase)
MRTGAARGYVGNFHEAGFYRSDAEFLALIVPFVTDGLAAGEPVVIGYDARKCDLLRATLPRSDGVTYIADASLYASPARAIEAYRKQFERHLAAGAGQIRIAGDVPHEGNGGRFAGWDRYESAVNCVWQDYPVWSRCLYDAMTVSDDVRDVVERTHRRLVTADGGAGASPGYQDVAQFERLPPPPDPLEATAPTVDLTNISLKQTRRRVSDIARGRISPTALDELRFALSEAVVNAELYGRPPMTVRIWAGEDRIVVHVHDTGPGPADPLTGLVPLPDDATGAGQGLWLSHQLDDVDIALISTDGFTVRLRSGPLPAREEIAPADPAPQDSVPRPFTPGAGTSSGMSPCPTAVHAIDGDGSSFCGSVAEAELAPLDDLVWSDVPRDQRCALCELLLAPSG